MAVTALWSLLWFREVRGARDQLMYVCALVALAASSVALVLAK